MTLDRYDKEILRLVAQEGRITWRDLADRIGLSLTPTLRRVRLLEQEGLIRGYHARLDEKRLAGGIIAFISVTLERQIKNSLDEFERSIVSHPEIMSGFLMTGGSDYLLRVVVHDLDHYSVLVDKLTRIPGVAHIQSSFALRQVINRHAPPVT